MVVMLIVSFQLQKSTSLSIDLSEIFYQKDTKQRTMMYGSIVLRYFCRRADFTSVNQHYSVCLPLVFGEPGQEHMHY